MLRGMGGCHEKEYTYMEGRFPDLPTNIHERKCFTRYDEVKTTSPPCTIVR